MQYNLNCVENAIKLQPTNLVIVTFTELLIMIVVVVVLVLVGWRWFACCLSCLTTLKHHISYWLGSLLAVVSDLWLSSHEFSPRPLHYRLVDTGMGDHLRASIPPQCVASHPGQPTSYSLWDGKWVPAKIVMMLCSWEWMQSVSFHS